LQVQQADQAPHRPRRGAHDADRPPAGGQRGDGRVHPVHAGEGEEPRAAEAEDDRRGVAVRAQCLHGRELRAQVDLAVDPDQEVALGPTRDLDLDHRCTGSCS
jgi:hypothetical protein